MIVLIGYTVRGLEWGGGGISPSFLQDLFCKSSELEEKWFEEVGDFYQGIILSYFISMVFSQFRSVFY